MRVNLGDLVLNEQVIEGKLACGYTYQEILLLLYKHCPLLREQLNAGDKLKSLTFNDINNGQGYISCIFKTTIEFQSNTRPFKVVLKVPTNEKLFDTVTDGTLDATMNKIHRKECAFYEMFTDLNDGFAPRFYYSEIASQSRPGVIIMEDLSERCITFGMLKSGTIEQFWKVIQIVAHFQAIAACMDKQEWKVKFVDDFHTDNLDTSFFEPMISSLIEYDPSLKEPVRKMRQVVSKRFSKYVLVDKPTEYNSLTLCHGDLWTNNILFEKNPDGSVSNTPLSFIDWQLVFAGNPFFDVTRYLIAANDGEIRREVQDQVVNYFVKMLNEEYQKQGNGSIKVPFTLEQARELFDLAFVEQTAVLMLLGPFVLNDQSSKHINSLLLKAQSAKLTLRCHLCIEDTLEIIEKRQLRNLFN